MPVFLLAFSYPVRNAKGGVSGGERSALGLMYAKCWVSGRNGLFIPNCLGDMYWLPYWLLWRKQLKTHSLMGHPMQPKHGSEDSFSCSSRHVRYWSHCDCSRKQRCVCWGDYWSLTGFLLFPFLLILRPQPVLLALLGFTVGLYS